MSKSSVSCHKNTRKKNYNKQSTRETDAECWNCSVNHLLRNHDECRRKLQRERSYMQQSLLALTTHLARIQLHLRQILQSPSWERDSLLKELERVAFKSASETNNDDLANIYHDLDSIDRTRKIQTKLMQKLHDQALYLMDNIKTKPCGKRYSPIKRK